jgi:hypothetical protein
MNRELPFLKRPTTQILIGLFAALLLYGFATVRAGGWLANIFTIFGQAFLCALGFILWFVFFLQFILPVRSLSDRGKLLGRIMLYFLGDRGPAIFIKDGKIIQKMIKTEGEVQAEIQKHGPGVIWLDPASAVVLRTATRFTRAVGPGIVFTQRGETVASVVDLHLQRQSLGPKESENPFAPKPDDMTDEKYKELQQRVRWATSGMTRDGIEVVAELSVVFKIDADESRKEGGTPFGYNADAVFKAVANEGINPNAKQDSLQYHIPWNELPAYVAVDLWREYLRKFTMNQLFETVQPDARSVEQEAALQHRSSTDLLFGSLPPPAAGKIPESRTALQFIVDMLNERLKKPETTVLDDFGRPSGQKAPSLEYALIKERGIKIVKASIRKVCLSPGIEEQLIRQWTANWLETARLEREHVEQKRSLAAHAGSEDAQEEFAFRLSREIMKKAPEHPREALELLLQATRKTISRDPALYQRMSTETQEITDIIQWLRGLA